MKQSFKILFCSLCLLGGAIGATPAADAASPKAKRTSTARKNTTAQSLKSIFQSNIGQYPFEINLLKKPALKNRLVKLMGASRYNYMCNNFDTQTPIEFENWNYHTFACQQHNCGGTEFEISYNPQTDNLCVRYRVNGNEKIFKEKSGNASWDY
ncbi:MAG: hypothetical protein J6L73_08270 [Muribaculaceae bacterium]|nr:hypothetical protein [Muribaculaceae bacterium]